MLSSSEFVVAKCWRGLARYYRSNRFSDPDFRHFKFGTMLERNSYPNRLRDFLLAVGSPEDLNCLSKQHPTPGWNPGGLGTRSIAWEPSNASFNICAARSPRSVVIFCEA